MMINVSNLEALNVEAVCTPLSKLTSSLQMRKSLRLTNWIAKKALPVKKFRERREDIANYENLKLALAVKRN